MTSWDFIFFSLASIPSNSCGTLGIMQRTPFGFWGKKLTWDFRRLSWYARKHLIGDDGDHGGGGDSSSDSDSDSGGHGGIGGHSDGCLCGVGHGGSHGGSGSMNDFSLLIFFYFFETR